MIEERKRLFTRNKDNKIYLENYDKELNAANFSMNESFLDKLNVSLFFGVHLLTNKKHN
jgi:hypothetical protein